MSNNDIYSNWLLEAHKDDKPICMRYVVVQAFKEGFAMGGALNANGTPLFACGMPDVISLQE